MSLVRNQDVFYELGVRHVLKGAGTIMILDEKESGIPFDLTTYRVIKFSSDVSGIGYLSNELRSFISEFEAGEVKSRDNLVHDILPELPMNVLATAQGSEEAQLRTEIQKLQRQVQGYVDRYGLLRSDAVTESPVELTRRALEEAQKGNLPSILVEEAVKSAKEGEYKSFLETVVRILEIKTTRPSLGALMRLMSAAETLDLNSVTEAILDHASSLYPTQREFRLIRLGRFSNSDDPGRREMAREELKKDLGIKMDGDDVELERPLARSDFAAFSVMLDTYIHDGLHEQSFRLVSKLYELYPNKSIVLRNMGRVLQERGDEPAALEQYIAAVNAPDADDTASVWLGNELHNRERHVDAIEAYSQACLRDPDDAANFAHLAEEISWAIVGEVSDLENHFRKLPDALNNHETFAYAIQAAIACGQLKAETAERLRTACNRMETDLEAIIAEVQDDSKMAIRSTRIEFAQKIRSQVLSSNDTKDKTEPEER